MSTQAIDFDPEFFVDESAHRGLRVGLLPLVSEDFRMRVKYADLALPETGVVEAYVLAAEKKEGKPQEFMVMLGVSGVTAPVQIGTMTYIGEAELSDTGELVEEMTSIVQRAFFVALRGDQITVQRAVKRTKETGAASAPPSTSGWCAKLFNWKVGGGAVALIAAGFVAFGVYQTQKPKDPIQEALASDNYKELQEKIRKQIASAGNGNGAFGALQGQNVAIDTMRAMGLDPGKANTGCLVGVK